MWPMNDKVEKTEPMKCETKGCNNPATTGLSKLDKDGMPIKLWFLCKKCYKERLKEKVIFN